MDLETKYGECDVLFSRFPGGSGAPTGVAFFSAARALCATIECHVVEGVRETELILCALHDIGSLKEPCAKCVGSIDKHLRVWQI
jgi:hypothetical protein